MSDSNTSDFMATLVENAKYIGGSSTNEKPRACQVLCEPQQAVLVACVDIVRASGDSSCMATAIQTWTKCCADANMAES